MTPAQSFLAGFVRGLTTVQTSPRRPARKPRPRLADAELRAELERAVPVLLSIFGLADEPEGV